MTKLASRLLSVGLCLAVVICLGAGDASAKHDHKDKGKGNGNGHGNKTCLCHIPPGNPSNAHTICVGGGAARAHLRHGDVLGDCPSIGACGGPGNIACPEDQFCSRPDGVCDPLSLGVCADVPSDCPSVVDPVCGCDGVTYSNSCYADVAGVGSFTPGACPIGLACSGGTGVLCAEGSFCRHLIGTCDTAAEGICFPLPPICPLTSDPVCGCDGTTYDNACLAAAAGVDVSTAGACVPTAQVCGGANPACATGTFCKKPDGACAADATGVCQPIEATCPGIVDPVCGCDGNTYSNPCVADAAGVTISHAGACVP